MNDPVSDDVLMQWYEIRDMILKQNQVLQDIPRALQLAVSCPHPDAQWLCKIFSGCNLNEIDAERAEAVFLDHPNDARAVVFGAMVNSPYFVDDTIVARSADMGDAFAQAVRADTFGGVVLEWAQKGS